VPRSGHRIVFHINATRFHGEAAVFPRRRCVFPRISCIFVRRKGFPWQNTAIFHGEVWFPWNNNAFVRRRYTFLRRRVGPYGPPYKFHLSPNENILLLHEWKHSLFVFYDTNILKMGKLYRIFKWIKYKTNTYRNTYALFKNNCQQIIATTKKSEKKCFSEELVW
jgi:hypothetical protein